MRRFNIVTTASLANLEDEQEDGAAMGVQKAFKEGITLDELRERLEMIVGIEGHAQAIEIAAATGEQRVPLTDAALLVDGATLFITDTSGKQEQQLKEEDVVRTTAPPNADLVAWMTEQKKKVGASDDAHHAFANGARVRLTDGRIGTVRYFGVPKSFGDGKTFYGIELDKAEGKNDGAVGSERLFQTKPKHGAFIQPSAIECTLSNENDDDDEF